MSDSTASRPSTPHGDPAELGFDPARLARIERHFARYVDDGRLPGWQVLVSRRGQIAYSATYGSRDVEEAKPWTDDTIVRMYSMTKAITSVAAMMLEEEGVIALKDPISKWIPAFADTPVYRQGSWQKPVTEPQTEPIRVWHLLTHTAGLTYGFHHTHPCDAIYRAKGYEWGVPKGTTLEKACNDWASAPLVFQPGSEWNYSVATDVLGRVVEVAGGRSLDAFFQERILGPLGMVDTGFYVQESEVDRAAALYIPNSADGKALKMDGLGPVITRPPAFLGGGGGLWGTAADYLRFVHMLLGRGALDGVRLLGSRTVGYMARNHLPGGADLEEFGRPLFSESTYAGVGFGLGFAVVDDSAKNKLPGSGGEFSWGGAASTAFWCDPVEDIGVVFLTQLLPSSTHPIRSELKSLVQQALVD